MGGWMGPRTVLDTVVKRKFPSPRRESNRRTPIVQPVAQRYTDWAIKAKAKKTKLNKTLQDFFANSKWDSQRFTKHMGLDERYSI
jgi:hypothetical protein